MREIAFYGKGGIGKSTVCANLSAAFAVIGRRILQIGCDPKHDSTRLLTHGAAVTTALDYMRVTNTPNYKLDEILFHGFGGVGCVEAGGPEPGVGCAGRGIISAFELLNRFKLKDNYDHIIYDVLGDVVCGGFAVPIRREYANAVFIVTSGEFMSLYAANNILRGIRNFDKDERRVAGIIYNKRNIPDEDKRVTRFAEAVRLPICVEIPRSEIFSEAESLKMTVIEYDANHGISKIFIDLVQTIIGRYNLQKAQPLDNDQLENIVLTGGKLKNTKKYRSGTQVTEALTVCGPKPVTTQVTAISQADEPHYFSKNMMRGEPLHGCAFNGAMAICTQISGVMSLAHSPKCCAYITHQTITHTGLRTMRVQGTLQSVFIAPNIDCTQMGETEAVFGGMEKLENKIHEIKARSSYPLASSYKYETYRGSGDPNIKRPALRAIIVVSSCPAGIIGDDIDRVQELSEPDMPIITIKADGNMNGDFLQGLLSGYISIARRVIKRDIQIIPKTVNIIAEKIILTNTIDNNFRVIHGFLTHMGVNVNCRFIYDTSFEAIENLCSAELNLLAYNDFTGAALQRFLTDEYGCKFFGMAFPVGFAETEAWLYGIAGFFNCPEAAETLITDNRKRYDTEINKLKKTLTGKKLLIITYNYELDWIIQTALDVGIEIVKIGLLNSYQDEDFRTSLDITFPVETGYDRENRAADIAKYRPDILLANYQFSLADEVPVADTIPLCPDTGFFSGLHLVRRWANLLKLDQKGEWRRDEQLFDKYFS